jgi:hypothetical protein
MSAIKLSTPSSGSISLSPADTASNLTITVPAVTGTAVLQNTSNNLLMNSGYGSDAVAFGCRAWVNFDGTGTASIRGSGNVSSITDLGTGSYEINFTTSMPDTNYCAATGYFYGTNDGGKLANFMFRYQDSTAAKCRVTLLDNGVAPYDPATCAVAI